MVSERAQLPIISFSTSNHRFLDLRSSPIISDLRSSPIISDLQSSSSFIVLSSSALFIVFISRSSLAKIIHCLLQIRL
ncbi:hypothetical protein DY000_02048893 [Brassica cretica]|uniref:Uncharacterized protein n=1 Tax=Brassica cretica TaxID=69181 RepID=A0ABQ7F5E3_BRACR|nr:hypothetical protein DY000_02048893 [Brassica cretica]